MTLNAQRYGRPPLGPNGQRRNQPETLEQLKTALQEEWQRIPQVSISSHCLYASPLSMQAVIYNNGSFTPY